MGQQNSQLSKDPDTDNISKDPDTDNISKETEGDKISQLAAEIINDVAQAIRSDKSGQTGVRNQSLNMASKLENMKRLSPENLYPPNFYKSPMVDEKVRKHCNSLAQTFKTKNAPDDTKHHPQDQSLWALVSSWVMYHFCTTVEKTKVAQETASVRNDREYRIRRHTAVLLVTQSELLPGDLLSIRIKLKFKHYGVYLGAYHNVHFVADLDVNADKRERSCTRVKTLQEFVSGSNANTLRIREWPDNAKVHSLTTLFYICQALMGLSFEYKLFNSNCENFSNYIYSGQDVCNQTNLLTGKIHTPRIKTIANGIVESNMKRLQILG